MRLVVGAGERHGGGIVNRQRFLGRTRGCQQGALGAGCQGCQTFNAMLCAKPFGNGVVKIIATQGRVAAGGQHFKHTLGKAQDGDVKGAAA